MCLFFLGWGFLGLASACVGLGRSEAVWHESGMYGSHGLSAFRLLNFAILMAVQGVGIFAHAKRDAKKADIYFWGWVVYAGLCVLLELSRLCVAAARAPPKRARGLKRNERRHRSLHRGK